MNPSGIRLGTPSLTTRGLTSHHMEKVVAFIHAALQLGVEVS
jgi:glycine/serine hydroxymethyltransferase